MRGASFRGQQHHLPAIPALTPGNAASQSFDATKSHSAANLRSSSSSSTPSPISILDGPGGDYAFLNSEKSLIEAVPGMQPAASLTGLTVVQAAAYQNDGVFRALGTGGIITLYLLPQSSRSTFGFYPLLAYYLAEAIGENAYNQALTQTEKQGMGAALRSPDSTRSTSSANSTASGLCTPAT